MVSLKCQETCHAPQYIEFTFDCRLQLERICVRRTRPRQLLHVRLAQFSPDVPWCTLVARDNLVFAPNTTEVNLDPFSPWSLYSDDPQTCCRTDPIHLYDLESLTSPHRRRAGEKDGTGACAADLTCFHDDECRNGSHAYVGTTWSAQGVA